jgi:hypothetical protein
MFPCPLARRDYGDLLILVSSSSTGADDLEPDLKDTSEGRLTEWRIVEVP